VADVGTFVVVVIGTTGAEGDGSEKGGEQQGAAVHSISPSCFSRFEGHSVFNGFNAGKRYWPRLPWVYRPESRAGNILTPARVAVMLDTPMTGRAVAGARLPILCGRGVSYWSWQDVGECKSGLSSVFRTCN